MILSSGSHSPNNANTNMRDPVWNSGRRACTLAMHPADAENLGVSDGETVRVMTIAGAEDIELEVTDRMRPGMVLLPHGFGLEFDGHTYGANANRLTPAKHRDRFAATPYHRNIPCRVEKITT